VPPNLVTIPNVPIVSVGEDWPAMTGPATFTRDDLLSMVAATDDPGVPTPKLKLTASQDTHGTPITEPAFGRVTNLRFDEATQTVFGDYEGVPAWLAEVLPVAYPNRSVETYGGFKTATGGYHKAVIGAVQLLGVEWPGCTVLSDLPLYYGAEKPETVQVNLKGGRMGRVQASFPVEDVRRAYYSELDSQGNFSWWIKAILLEPNQLVVEDEWEGKLYTVDFNVSGDSVSFGDPSPVKIEYVPIPEAPAAAASIAAAGFLYDKKVAASYQTARESGREVKLKKEEGGEGMTDDQRKALAKKYGLPEDATVEQVQTKMVEDAMGSLEPAADDTQPLEIPILQQQPATTPAPTVGNESTGTEALPVAASSGLTVTMDRGRAEQLERDAQLGREARLAQVKNEASSLVEAAVVDGRIAPASRADWMAAIFDEKGCRIVESEAQVLAGLGKGRIPVDERGAGGGGSDDPAQQFATSEAYPAQWFPEVAARKASWAALQGRRPLVANETVKVN
jgi:hypothetical protein